MQGQACSTVWYLTLVYRRRQQGIAHQLARCRNCRKDLQARRLENESPCSCIGSEQATIRDLLKENFGTKAFSKSTSGLNRFAAHDGQVAQGYALAALPSLCTSCPLQRSASASGVSRAACLSCLFGSRSCRSRAASAAAPGQERAAVRLAQRRQARRRSPRRRPPHRRHLRTLFRETGTGRLHS